MTQLSDWASQYRSDLEKQSSARAAQVESLLTVGDYEAIREWLDQWEQEDKAQTLSSKGIVKSVPNCGKNVTNSINANSMAQCLTNLRVEPAPKV